MRRDAMASEEERKTWDAHLRATGATAGLGRWLDLLLSRRHGRCLPSHDPRRKLSQLISSRRTNADARTAMWSAQLENGFAELLAVQRPGAPDGLDENLTAAVPARRLKGGIGAWEGTLSSGYRELHERGMLFVATGRSTNAAPQDRDSRA